MGIVVDGQTRPLTSRVQSIQDVIEDLVQWDAAFIASFGNVQAGTDVLLELVLRYTDRDSAHAGSPLVGFFLS